MVNQVRLLGDIPKASILTSSRSIRNHEVERDRFARLMTEVDAECEGMEVSEGMEGRVMQLSETEQWRDGEMW